MDPLTPLETLCRIILRAREYEAQTPTDYNGDEAADNVDDDEEGALSVLDDAINDSVEEELRAILEDLGEDQLAEVVAFCWVGQGTYEVAEWDEAMDDAARQDALASPAALDAPPDAPDVAIGAPLMVDSARRDYVALCGLPEDEFFADAFTTAADLADQ